MSLRVVPADSHSSSFSHLPERQKGAPSAPGLHDTLRYGVGPSSYSPYGALASSSAAKSTASSSSSTAAAPESAHPLEARLKAWEATQESLRMESLRRAFGMAEPIRRGMELKIAREGEWRPVALRVGGLPSLHEEVLRGREAAIEGWEDVFTGDEARGVPGFHDEMERKLRM